MFYPCLHGIEVSRWAQTGVKQCLAILIHKPRGTRTHGPFRKNHSLDFSEFMHEGIISFYQRNSIFRFFIKLRLRPQGLKKGKKKPPKYPEMAKNDTLPHHFLSVHQKCSKNLKIIDTNIKSLLWTLTKLRFASPGDFQG